MANAITSLRLCSTLDWTHFFERVSLIEQVLQRDPAGVYADMDFASRDRYRHAVEELAEPIGEAQMRVALRSVESARQAAEKDPADRAAHVGLPPHREGTPGPRDRRGATARGCPAAAPRGLPARHRGLPRGHRRS